MKQLSLSISTVAVLALAASCGAPGNGGQLVGSPNTLMYKPPVPVGMVYVPTGVLKMGASDQDMTGKNDALIHNAQISGFYMDATEISNAEYRQFTNYVRDSIAHTLLGDFIDDPVTGGQRLDMRRPVNYRNQDVQEQLASMYIPAEQSLWGRRELDSRKLVYHYEYADYDAAVKNPGQPLNNYIVKKDLPIYPDTTVWVRQFTYSYNEPIAQQYNWFPAFNNYPVVGVNYHQANAFTIWRTKTWKSDRDKSKLYLESEFRLPTEQQWEWAARGGRNQSPYPWGGPYLLNKKGCYLANFKPLRGNYAADGGLYTVPVNKYWANDYGLYNMAGNVAEWTSTPYAGNSYNVIADMNPDMQAKVRDNDAVWQKRMVIRGGSWRDNSYYLQNGTRDYEFADTTKAYIGFRCIYQQIEPALRNNR